MVVGILIGGVNGGRILSDDFVDKMRANWRGDIPFNLVLGRSAKYDNGLSSKDNANLCSYFERIRTLMDKEE